MGVGVTVEPFLHAFRTDLLVELQSFVLAVMPHDVSALIGLLHAAAGALLPAVNTEHAETQRSSLRGLDHGRRRLVLFHWNPIHLHHIVPRSQSTPARWRVGHAVLHQQGTVSHYGEAKTTIRPWGNVQLVVSFCKGKRREI